MAVTFDVSPYEDGPDNKGYYRVGGGRTVPQTRMLEEQQEAQKILREAQMNCGNCSDKFPVLSLHLHVNYDAGKKLSILCTECLDLFALTIDGG